MLVSIITGVEMGNEDNTEINPAALQSPTPWGFWPTIGFTLLFMIVSTLIQAGLISVIIGVVKIRDPGIDVKQFARSIVFNGLFLSIITCATAPVSIGMTILFAKLRKGITLKDYFSLNTIGWKELFKWMLALILLEVIFASLASIINLPFQKFMSDIYNTAYNLDLLLVTLVIVVPVTEEIFFRGFLLRGIQHSRLGAIGAVVISSLAWTGLHVQYDLFVMFILFMDGLLLGYAKIKSNSLYTPIIMHSLMNLIGVICTAIYVNST